MKRFSFLLFLLVHFSARSQSPSGEIYLGLRKLNIVGSVLYIAAHPDDENTRLLTYLSKERQYRTGYLSLTRGDGGQNLIGDEQGIPLGLIRTQELLSARRIDGAEQFFTRAFDFGYSKTPEETFTKWDREKILADVVWVIRKFRPDVIITRFPTTGEGGHGHHTVSAILANEAFKAAADASRFPEQLKFVEPWQATRILWNVFGGNPSNTTLKVDVGGYNAVLGKSYGEIAAESRSQHKSQGFGVQRTRGEAFEFFNLTGGSAPVSDIMDGIKTDWSRVNGGDNIPAQINNLINGFDFMQPQRSLPALVQLYKAMIMLPDSYWKTKKIAEVRDLVEQASGVWLECYASQSSVSQGDSVRVNFSINDRSGAGAILHNILVESFDTSMNMPLIGNRNLNFARTVRVFPTTPVTQPYWLEKPREEGYFNIPLQTQVGQPDVDPALVAHFSVNINGMEFKFTRPVRYKFTDQVKGEQVQPLIVLPSLTVYGNPELILIKKGDTKEKTFTVQAVANRDIDKTLVLARADLDNKKQLTEAEPATAIKKGSQVSFLFHPKTSELGNQPVRAMTSVAVHGNGKVPNAVYNLAQATIRYDHIPYINYFYNDWVKLVPIDLVTYNKKIGYITGAGDKVPEALEEMGYEVTLLTEKEMARNNLQQYDAIITGVRAFNALDWLDRYYDKLMKYVENGGNYIVQYSQANNIRGRIGPYPMTISGKRITDEKAQVDFIHPDHPVLNFPNRITQDDFRDWVQERSIYHAATLDSNYTTILRMHDPGEQPDDGSLVIAKYGKGYFTYTGLVFFRELPAGVPGAYRLLANIIALNRKMEF